jgi:hypothetical protein
MWRCAIAVVVLGCGGEGRSPDAGPAPVETGAFVPLICTGGSPGTPSCPINQVSLDDIGANGKFVFVMQFVSSGPVLTNIMFVAGPQGIYLEHPDLLIWPRGSMISTATATLDGGNAIYNIAPDATVVPSSGSITFVGNIDKFALRFDVVGSYRP